ncbi:MAG: septum formation protein Maf [Bacteroidaceae bacterium]|nr:septum formation protein Maf [Bacteroidaceae bacterium]
MMMNLEKYHVILASNSPRRKELLRGLGIDFEVRTLPYIDESYPDTLQCGDIPLYISREKADAYRASMADDELLITADTIVWLHGEVLGKPRDRNEAIQMLHKLSGNTHQVYTGVTLTTRDWQHSFSVETHVHFARLTDAEITYYVDHYRPFDKAGAYGVQEWIGYVGVEGLEGSYYNVMGLPVQRLYRELQKLEATKTK